MLKGQMGIGKSTLSRALGKRLLWPIVDKDDYSDVLLRHLKSHGAAVYNCMFSATQGLLEQGFRVICDSPLRGEVGYRLAKALVEGVQAAFVVLECSLTDKTLWRERIEKRRWRPAHPVQTWQELLTYRQNAVADFDYFMLTLTLQLDMAERLEQNVARAISWLSVEVNHKENSL